MAMNPVLIMKRWVRYWHSFAGLGVRGDEAASMTLDRFDIKDYSVFADAYNSVGQINADMPIVIGVTKVY